MRSAKEGLQVTVGEVGGQLSAFGGEALTIHMSLVRYILPEDLITTMTRSMPGPNET